MPNPESDERQSTLRVPDIDQDHIGWLSFKHTALNPYFAKTSPNRPPVKVVKLTGKALEESIADSERARKDNEFFQTRYKEFLAKYPDQWIGILDEKLMGVAETRPALRAKFKAKGIPMNYMLVKRLTAKREI